MSQNASNQDQAPPPVVDPETTLQTVIKWKQPDLPEQVRLKQKHINPNKSEVCMGMWNGYNLSARSKNIQQWKTNALYAYSNQNPNILKQIEHISFPTLKILSIFDNGMTSIENINRLYAPHLQGLFLGKNNLATLKNLRKCNWRLSRFNYAANNTVDEWDWVSQLAFADFIDFIEIYGPSQIMAIKKMVKIQSIQGYQFRANQLHRWTVTCLTMQKINRSRNDIPHS